MSWLLQPTKVLDREQRWFAFKKEEARFYKNIGQYDEATFDACVSELDARAGAVGGDSVTGMPSAEVLAKEFCRTPLVYDMFYRWTSQAVHGTLIGAGTFDPGTRLEWYEAGGHGEWVEAEFWSMPLAACWEAAVVALPIYRNLLAPGFSMPSLDREKDFRGALRRVPANYQARRDLKLEDSYGGTIRHAPAGNSAQRRAAERKAGRKGRA